MLIMHDMNKLEWEIEFYSFFVKHAPSYLASRNRRAFSIHAYLILQLISTSLKISEMKIMPLLYCCTFWFTEWRKEKLYYHFKNISSNQFSRWFSNIYQKSRKKINFTEFSVKFPSLTQCQKLSWNHLFSNFFSHTASEINSQFNYLYY